MPTTTDLLPCVIVRAWGALIWFVSHCSEESGSPVPVGLGGVWGSHRFGRRVGSLGESAPVVIATPFTRAFAAILAAKVVLVEVATTTPISGYDATKVPPAAATSAAAVEGTEDAW